MKLWADSKENSPGTMVHATIKGQVEKINRQVLSRGVRAVNAIRNAELEVLRGQRSGKKYRKPYTKRATYIASAPGEAPARRTGNLRLHWTGQVKKEMAANNGVRIIAELESQEKYSGFLEEGTSKMAARPFVERIKEKAQIEIKKIYHTPST